MKNQVSAVRVRPQAHFDSLRSLSVNMGSGAKYPEQSRGAQTYMPWHVYIARARTGNYYVGISPDPQKRIVQHNNGKGSQMARQQGPFALVYVSSPFPNKSEVRKREAQIKKWSRAKKEKLIMGEFV